MDAEVRRRWWWVLERLRAEHPSVERVLRRGRLEEVSGDEVTISWPWPFHCWTISQPERRRLIEGAIGEVMDRPYSLRCIVASPYVARARATTPRGAR